MDLNDVVINIEEKNISTYELEDVIVEPNTLYTKEQTNNLYKDDQTNNLYTKEQNNNLHTKEQMNKLYDLNNTYIQIKNRIFNDLFVYLLPVLELEKIHQSHEK